MSRDLRQYARQTNFRLIVGFILLLFIVGDGLIYLFYGQGAALMGLICLLGGFASDSADPCCIMDHRLGRKAE